MKKATLYALTISAMLLASAPAATAADSKGGASDWQNLSNFTQQEYSYFKQKTEELSALDKKLQTLNKEAENAKQSAAKTQAWDEMMPAEKKLKELQKEISERDAKSSRKLFEMVKTKVGGEAPEGGEAASDEQGGQGQAGGAGDMAAALGKALGGAKKAGKAPGPREAAQKEMDDKLKKEGEEFEKSLKAMPLDPKEVLVKEFEDRVKKERAELDEKIKGMPAGPKELKRIEFNKKIFAEKKEMADKIAAMPADPQ